MAKIEMSSGAKHGGDPADFSRGATLSADSRMRSFPARHNGDLSIVAGFISSRPRTVRSRTSAVAASRATDYKTRAHETGAFIESQSVTGKAIGVSQIPPSDAIRPNLFIVGAAKSGSTSLYVGLKSHPDIFMSDPKEPGFFVPPCFRPARLFGSSATEREALRTYLDLFCGAGNRRCVGEASTDYTMYPHRGPTAEAIHEFAPAGRIIYIVRDPIERTISDYWWHVKLEFEDRHPYQAITEDSRYCDVSRYAMQIGRYFERFSRDQVWVLTLEEFSRDPAAELERIFRWLELDPRRALPLAEIRENVTPPTLIRDRMPKCLSQFQQSRPYQTIRPLIPSPVRGILRRFLSKRIERSQVDMDGVKAFLRPIQQRETEELADLLGRDFRDWTTLYERRGTTTKSSPLAAVS
jgi:hypothetical protein